MSVLSQRLTAPHRERVVKNPLPWYTPRFWHGMRFSTWIGQLARHRFSISPSRLPMAASITGFSLLNSALAALERLRFGSQIDRVEMSAPPLFILGHWRSGTTLLHELLIRDPSHAYPTTYQCFAPHHFNLTEDLLTPWSEFLLPSRRPMDNMAAGWQRPQEDEFALGNLGVPSPYLSMMFPNHGEAYPEYLTLDDVPPADRDRWKSELLAFFKRLAFRDNRRIVVKSPPHTGRVALLREMFPEARFVHISRNPEALFASTISLWRSLNEVQSLHVIRNDDWVSDYVLASLPRMYAAYFRDREALPSNRLAEVRYEDLTEDPKASLKRIYQQLELGDFAEIEKPVDEYLAEVKNYRPNRHEFDEQARSMLHDAWADYYREFGYE
ncbi:MAG: sulfotransferase [Planctomycetales bacterium]|nr:sulfotransferase [Planctomycetales bacterium]